MAVDYFRVNPHRLQLGNIGMEIIKKNGQPATLQDIQNIQQQLDMWTGAVSSRFTVEDQPVEVITYAHQQLDLISVKVTSPLVKQKRLQLTIHFPYPNGEFKDVGTNEANAGKHTSQLINQSTTNGQAVTTGQATQSGQTSNSNHSAIIRHSLDTTQYYLHCSWQQPAAIQQQSPASLHHHPTGNDNNHRSIFPFLAPINQSTNPPLHGNSNQQSAAVEIILEERRRHRPCRQYG
jgi:hypothetical protein